MGGFCVIAIIVSELLADIPWLSDQLRLQGIVMISQFLPVLRAGTKADLEKIFVGGSGLQLLRCLENWSRKFY